MSCVPRPRSGITAARLSAVSKSVPPTRTPAFASTSSAAIGALAVLRADTDDGKVARAAADVGDEHQLFALDRLFVVVGRRDGLIHERDVAKAHPSGNGLEHLLRPRICRVVVVDEAHRPAVHDGRDLLAGEGFGLVFQMPHEDLDDFA